MPTQQEIADHLGLNQSEVSRHMKTLGLNWKVETMDTIRLAYISHLREVAAGHQASDGDDLTKVRIENERLDIEMKQLTLAEKKGTLINLEQLRPNLHTAFLHIKTTLRGASGKIKTIVDARYNIDLDIGILQSEIDNGLAELARHAGGN